MPKFASFTQILGNQATFSKIWQRHFFVFIAIHFHAKNHENPPSGFQEKCVTDGRTDGRTDVRKDGTDFIGPLRQSRGSKNQTNNDRRPRPRTIVCKLLRFKDKQKIIQSSKRLKNSGIFVYEDFCKDTEDH